MRLKRGERIVAVVPEHSSGPGWSNTPCWVYVQEQGGGPIRRECLQPEEQGEAIRTLYRPGAAMAAELIGHAWGQVVVEEQDDE